MEERRRPSRRAVLATVGTGAAVSLTGCGGILGGGPTYECLEVTATHSGERLSYAMELVYHEVGGDRRVLHTDRSGELQEKTHERPSDCNEEFFRPEEHDRTRPPITATIELESASDVADDRPAEFTLAVDGEVVDSAEATRSVDAVELSHEG